MLRELSTESKDPFSHHGLSLRRVWCNSGQQLCSLREVLQDDACVVGIRGFFQMTSKTHRAYFSTRIKSPLDAFTATLSL